MNDWVFSTYMEMVKVLIDYSASHFMHMVEIKIFFFEKLSISRANNEYFEK